MVLRLASPLAGPDPTSLGRCSPLNFHTVVQIVEFENLRTETVVWLELEETAVRCGVMDLLDSGALRNSAGSRTRGATSILAINLEVLRELLLNAKMRRCP